MHSLLVIDAVGWWSMYFVVIHSPSMLFIFYGEDTTSELWTPVHSFTIDYNLLQTLFSLFTANKHHLPHYTFNLLF